MIRDLLHGAAAAGGPRRGEVDRLLAECEKEWASIPAPVPAPPPTPDPPAPSVAARRQILLTESFEAGRGRFQRGEVVEVDGVHALSFEAEGAPIDFFPPLSVRPGTILRFRLRPTTDLPTAEVALWATGGRANAWHHVTGLRKGVWTSVEVRLGRLKLGYQGNGAPLEGDGVSTFNFYFGDAPAGVRMLLDDVEISEE
jgi:hypothetical protein